MVGQRFLCTLFTMQATDGRNERRDDKEDIFYIFNLSFGNSCELCDDSLPVCFNGLYSNQFCRCEQENGHLHCWVKCQRFYFFFFKETQFFRRNSVFSKELSFLNETKTFLFLKETETLRPIEIDILA